MFCRFLQCHYEATFVTKNAIAAKKQCDPMQTLLHQGSSPDHSLYNNSVSNLWKMAWTLFDAVEKEFTIWENMVHNAIITRTPGTRNFCSWAPVWKNTFRRYSYYSSFKKRFCSIWSTFSWECLMFRFRQSRFLFKATEPLQLLYMFFSTVWLPAVLETIRQ